jgi:CBS domain-containing protein
LQLQNGTAQSCDRVLEGAAMHIKEIMTHPVVTCPVNSTLDQAARLMWEFDCGIIPVVGDNGRLAGVVTDRDICMAAYTQGRALSAIPVSTAMARQVVAVHGDEGIEQAEYLMRESQIRRLPVLDAENRPVGIISMNDLARLADRGHRSKVDRELVQTLAAVSRPRADRHVHAVEQPRAPQALVTL